VLSAWAFPFEAQGLCVLAYESISHKADQMQQSVLEKACPHRNYAVFVGSVGLVALRQCPQSINQQQQPQHVNERDTWQPKWLQEPSVELLCYINTICGHQQQSEQHAQKFLHGLLLMMLPEVIFGPLYRSRCCLHIAPGRVFVALALVQAIDAFHF